MKKNLAQLTKLSLLVSFTVMLLAGTAELYANPLDKAFRNPSEESKPWCYWYWLEGDVSKEGITKDLEAMAQVGIKLAMIGNIHGVTKNTKGTVRMFSPEWYDLTLHAFREANRLSVDLMMFNGPGWSQSGGPWIKPEQSMRRVAWSETPAQGGAFDQKIRPSGTLPNQDIAVLAVPRLPSVSIDGQPDSPSAAGNTIRLTPASWIWHPLEKASTAAPAGIRHFKREFQADPASLLAAQVKVTADNSYVLSVNGKPVLQDGDWKTQESASIMRYLRKGLNSLTVEVTNPEVSPAGLIAAVRLEGKGGKVENIVTDGSWLVSKTGRDGWLPAEVVGPSNTRPWGLVDSPNAASSALRFASLEPFTARSLIVHGKGKGKLYAVRDGQRQFIADIDAAGGRAQTDFLPDAVETFSFPEVTASEFELTPAFACRVELGSAPVVAQVIEKQMGRMHPTPSPTWQSYIFPATVEPAEAAPLVRQSAILNLTDKLQADGTLRCTLPEGDWTIIHFGMVTTGKKNAPASPEATGLEVDKLSTAHTRYHFTSSIGPLMERMSPQERAAFKGITIDSYEVGSQNWTDGFATEFEKRNGYNPIALLPVLTGRVIDSAKASDRFLWDLRRTVADMIAENYVGGLRDIAHENKLRLWCENYGHWGFPGEFTIYGGYTDEIGGEFWTTNSNLGTIECRAASSTGHIYGKRRVYAEAFTSKLIPSHHPATIKARGEELFCEGINHFVLHVYAHQARDGAPGMNPWFGTAFHRNTPWFMQSRDWVTYLQRCHTMLQQGEPVADVAVYIGDFAPQMTGPANPVPTGYDYDYMGSDAILRKLDVVDGEWVVYDEKDPQRISARWKLLAMPQAGTLREKVRQRLDTLKTKGGKVVEGVPVTAATLRDAGISPLVAEATCPIHWKARRLDDGMVFFLSNFKETGTFEATLRVTGKVPELFDPVTGNIRKLARFKTVEGGTRIALDILDSSDSCFLVFRDQPASPSVVEVSTASGPVAPRQLDLFFDTEGILTAESSTAVKCSLKMSDGSTRQLVIDNSGETLAITGPWKTTANDAQGFSVTQETAFEVPQGFGEGRRLTLDLGQVSVMAKVSLNGKIHDTLWRSPYTIDVTDEVKPGTNQLKVLVTSTSQTQSTLGEVKLRTSSRVSVK